MVVFKFLRYLLYVVSAVLVAILLFALASVIPIDRTSYKQKSFYKKMTTQLDSLRGISIPKPAHRFFVGWAKENLTPDFPVATAGYGNRKGKVFTSVHDSIYVRTIVLDNGTQRVAIVSADLLIIPPTVTELLAQQLPAIGFSLENTYLGATHTHNSMGNWGKGIAGFLYGSYNDTVVKFIAEKIMKSIVRASANMKPADIKAGAIPVKNAVQNRLDSEHGSVDSLLRLVEFHCHDSTRLLIMSYTAHPTCLFSRDFELSRDYPGKLVDDIEDSGYSFAMFLAGAVGSHGCNPPEYGWDCIDWMAEEITHKFQMEKGQLKPVYDSTLFMVRIPLQLGEPQIKVSKNWRLRPWLFRSLLGEYQSYLTALRLGDMVMLGMPCDFSGELSARVDSLAAQNGLQTMITSFNGHYIGYITKDEYYDRKHYETQLMNWHGPGNGAYLTESAIKILESISR